MAIRPTDILKAEHQDVLQKLDALEDVINRLDEKATIAAPLKDLTTFFNTDFWTHFAKEEEALFPELEKFIPRNAGPLGVMLAEHKDLRRTNAEIQRATDDYLSGSDNLQTRTMLRNQGTHFVRVLRDHIDKEDNILFMMADMHLDQGQVRSVLELFEKIKASGAKTLQT